MAVFNIQLTIPQYPAGPTLLIHLGVACKAYFSWSKSGIPGGALYFGGPGLTINNGFAVSSASSWEPFVVEVPANDYLYVINAEAGINADRLLTMLVIY